MIRIALCLTLLAIPVSARAQVVTNLNDPTYLAVTTNIPNNFGALCGSSYCITTQQGIPLNYFATAASVQSLAGRLDAMQQMQTQIGSMNRDISRSFEIGAIASAMKDAIPNAGDRYALRINAAGLEGYAAGAVGFSVNMSDSVRLSVNYGRSSTQNVVSGGLNFSFH